MKTEAEHQAEIATWLDWKKILWCHVPNEGKRGPAYAGMLKRIGLKSGVPDILIFKAPPAMSEYYVGCAIELKRDKKCRVTKSQKLWLDDLLTEGWLVTVCHGAEDAIRFLKDMGY